MKELQKLFYFRKKIQPISDRKNLISTNWNVNLVKNALMRLKIPKPFILSRRNQTFRLRKIASQFPSNGAVHDYDLFTLTNLDPNSDSCAVQLGLESKPPW